MLAKDIPPEGWRERNLRFSLLERCTNTGKPFSSTASHRY